MTALTTTLSLHRAWWDAMSKLAESQAACGCFDVSCEDHDELRATLLAAEQALREAGEWEVPTSG